MEHFIKKSDLKICLISTTPYPGVYFPELRNIAFELEKIGKNIVIIAVKQSLDDPDFEIAEKKRIYRIPFFRRIEQETFFMRCAFIIYKENTPIIHIFWRFGAALLPLLFSFSSKRFIVDIRTGSVSNHLIRRRVENILLRIESIFFHRRLVVDEPLAKKLGIRSDEYLPQGIPSHMIDAHYSPNELHTLREKLGISTNDTIGIYVGTSYLRNLDIFFEGCRQVKKTIPSLKIIIIGDALYDEHLHKLIESTELKKYITLLGSVPNENVASYMKIAHFGISFVPITKGFDKQQSIKILEYIANDLPVLATKTSSNQSFIYDGQNGILINDTVEDVISGIRRMAVLLSDRKFRHHLTSFNEQFIKEFSWEKLVQNKLLPLYER